MFLFKKAPPAPFRTIAICGSEHGIGATHFALCLSNYLCSSLRKRTAYVELNKSAQIRALAEEENDGRPFCYMDIFCYPSAIGEDLPRIFAERYAFIVLDLGVLSSDSYWDFYRCDLKFIIGSVSPWRIDRFGELLESLLYHADTKQEHIMLMGNLGIKETMKPFRQSCRFPVNAIPFLPNPFHFTAANCTFFQELLAKCGISIP